MANKRVKLGIKADKIKKEYSELIQQGYNLVDISEMMGIPVMKLLHYSALIKEAPNVGRIDLNWFLNGRYLREQEIQQEREKVEKEKPFRPSDEWWQQ